MQKAAVWAGVAGAVVYAAGMALGVPWMMWLAKPVPMLAMLAVVAPLPGRYARTLAVGLALSLVGDVLLMVPPGVADLFVPGLVAFLLAHVAYMAAFSRGVALRPGRLLPPLALGGAVSAVVLPRVGVLAVPVAAYVLAIVGMAWRALARVDDVDRAHRGQVAGAVGAFLFLASDATLAINKFVTPVAAAGWIVMSTYWAAQVGITLSAADRPEGAAV